MRILGVEFNGHDMNYVLIERGKESFHVLSAAKLSLPETRSSDAMSAFQAALQAVLADAKAEVIAVKQKPESGQMRAGAAALKMEAVLLANCGKPIDFVSAVRFNKVEEAGGELFVYLRPALKTARAAR